MMRGIVLTVAFVMAVTGALLAVRYGFFDQHYSSAGGSTKCHAFAREIWSVNVNGAGENSPKRVADGCVSRAQKMTLLGGVVLVLGVGAGTVVFRRPELPAL